MIPGNKGEVRTGRGSATEVGAIHRANGSGTEGVQPPQGNNQAAERVHRPEGPTLPTANLGPLRDGELNSASRGRLHQRQKEIHGAGNR